MAYEYGAGGGGGCPPPDGVDDALDYPYGLTLEEWARDKPLSILQLDPADRAVLRIAGHFSSHFSIVTRICSTVFVCFFSIFEKLLIDVNLGEKISMKTFRFVHFSTFSTKLIFIDIGYQYL